MVSSRLARRLRAVPRLLAGRHNHPRRHSEKAGALTKRIAISIVSVLLFLGGCGDSAGPINDHTNQPPQGNPDGVLLPGNPSDNALAATYNLPPWPASDTEMDNDFIKTRLESMISPTATVGEVNTALTNHNARIISMSPTNAFMSLKIDAAATPADANMLGDSLVETGAFLAAVPAFALTVESALADVRADGGPQRVLPPSGGRLMTYAKAAHMPAAWNARGAMASKPIVYVPDSYASLTVPAQLPGQVFVGRSRVLANNDRGNHGIHVCGTIGALFDNALPTGVLPASGKGSLEIRSNPVANLPWLDMLKEIYDFFPSGRFIMNTSLAYNDPTFARYGKVTRALHAMYWRARVADKNGRFLHATAAGNDGDVSGDGGEARFGSPFCASALVSDLRDLVAGESLSDADSIAVAESWKLLVQANVHAMPENVLVVGSTDTTGAESAFSSRGSDLCAVGEEVWSLCSFRQLGGGVGDCDGNIARREGTSMATPQIAGLAAYMWSIDKNLGIQKTIELIRNAYSAGSTAGTIDAYMAILSVDQGLGSAPVRKNLLDVAGNSDAPGSNGKFDHHDIKVYLDKFAALGGGMDDYSRWDLNGDGTTGDLFTAPMDLTADPTPTLSTASVMIEGKPALIDETAVSDLEALCYYAYSALYTGDNNVRKNLLQECLTLTGPKGTAAIISAEHDIRTSVQTSVAVETENCVPDVPCEPQYDEFIDTSTQWSYSKMGHVSSSCLGATAMSDVSADGVTNADLSTGVFTFIDGSISVSASFTTAGPYSAVIGLSGPTASSVRWLFQVKDADVSYQVTGGASGTPFSGAAHVRLLASDSGGSPTGTIVFQRFIQDASVTWDESGKLSPGYYVLWGTVGVGIYGSCGESATEMTDTSFNLTITP